VLPHDGLYAVVCRDGKGGTADGAASAEDAQGAEGAGGAVAELRIEGESLALDGPGAAGAVEVIFAHR
jgi:hypothetical protein